MNINRIIEIVCSDKDYQLDPECVQWQIRLKKIIYPRQMCHYFAWKYTNETTAKIGEKIGGREHSTVLHSIKTVMTFCGNDKQYLKRFHRIEERIKFELRKNKATMSTYQERKLIFAV